MKLDTVEDLPFINKIKREYIRPNSIFPSWKEGRGYILKFSLINDSNKSAYTDKCILYVHGGGFFHDNPKTNSYQSIAYILCFLTGYDIYVPDYAIVPYSSYPTQVNEVLSLTDSLKPKYKGIIMGSDSAGCTIAMSSILKKPKLYHSAFFISAWLNLYSNSESYYTRAHCDALNTGDRIYKDKPKKLIRDSREIAVKYLGSEKLLKNEIANPYLASKKLLGSIPPILMMVGDNEVLRNDTLDFAARCQQVNNNVFVNLYDNVWHDWPLYSQNDESKKGISAYQIIQNFCLGKIIKKKFVFENLSQLLQVSCNIVL